MWGILSIFSLIFLFFVTGRVEGLYLSIPFFLLGYLLSRLKGRGIYAFLFILPFINAFSYFLPTGFPFNYYAPSLFLLSGFFVGKIIRGYKIEVPFYGDFLLILALSFLFLFLRWSNITLSPLAFLRDTPITTTGQRLSFGAFFPILTLAIYSLSPLALFLLEGIDRRKAYRYLSLGTFISFLIAVVQISGSKFMLSPGTRHGIAYNGGFSDTPGAGTFGGILFALIILNYKEIKDLFFLLPPLFMVAFSGSRSGFILLVFSVLFFLASKNVNKTIRIGTFALIIVLFIPFSGILKKRIVSRIKTAERMPGIIKKLDIITSRRITLSRKAFVAMKEFPVSGVGAGNYYLYNMYKFKHGRNDVAPSLYLAPLSELGIIGGLFFFLFLASFAIGKSSPEKKVFYILLFVFLFNNALWNPEVAILFWILLSGIKPGKFRLGKWFTPALAAVFIVSSLVTFNSLHPAKWAVKKGALYDYGFWYSEGNFKWTKGAAGIYGVFRGEKIELTSGYPFDRSKYDKQVVNIFWKGKFLKKIILTPTKREKEFAVKGEGFLEFRVKPWFRPSDFRLSSDPRELGVQVKGIW